MKKFITIALFCVFFSCKDSSNTNKLDTVDSSEINLVETGEQFRPDFHFTPEKNWMNDPNGMVFYQGEYHLFYQYYPDDNVWGPMHWGHAISKDLVSWERLPIGLYPDELGYIFSGSAVIDWDNTTGFGTEENPPMVAIFTYHDPIGEKKETSTFQYQGIAFSLDNGRSWTKYESNPVLKNPGIRDFRDPKVIWHEDSSKWIMVLAVKDQVNIYSSINLLDWNLESEIGKSIGAHGGVWECPDLFSMKDEDGNEKWIMLISINPGAPQGGSGTQYLIGEFDGKTFKPDDEIIRWIDYGADNYAGVTFSDIPKEDGRRIFIGWMSNWDYAQKVPTFSWRSAMTIPRELLLRKNSTGYFVQSKPVNELKSLLKKVEIVEGKEISSKSSAYYCEIEKDNNVDLVLNLSNDLNENLKISIKEGVVSIDRTKAGDSSFKPEFAAVHNASIKLEEINNLKLYVDNSSIELFVNDGELVMTDLIFPTKPLTKLVIKGDVNSFQYSPIKSIWNN